MAGKGLYLVGPNQVYKQPEDAVIALVQDQGATQFSSAQEIRIVESGGYKPFTISGTLRPGSLGLTVGAAAGVEAVIDGALVPSASTAVRIESHVTFVTVKSLITRGTRYGISFNSGAHNGKVDKCRCYSHTSWGVYSWLCNDMQVVNNEIWACRIGIALYSSRDTFIAHNSIYSKPLEAGSIQAGVLISHQGDMRADQNLFNNVIFADGTSCVWIKSSEVKDLVSNGNCFYAPGGALVNVYTPQKVTPVRTIPFQNKKYKSMSEWRAYSGQDKNSISTTPYFEKIAPDTNGSTISLRPLSISPLLKKAPKLSTLTVTRSYTGTGYYVEETSAAIPSSASASDVATDIAGFSRTSEPAIGAYEVPVQQPEPENDDPVTQPDNTDTGVSQYAQAGELVCGDRASIIDRAVLQMKQEVPCWHPEVHRGYFFVRDMPYYLYAEKLGVTLGDITFTEFDLDVDPLETGLTVSVGTTELAEGLWDKHGPRIRVLHKDLDLDHLGDALVVEGNYLEWDTGTDGFDERVIRYEFSMAAGRRRYVLPVPHLDAGPVVVTDDTINPLNNRDHLPMQFQVGEPVGDWGSEITFRNPNLLRNSAFHYQTSSLPDDWDYDTGIAAPSLHASISQSGQYDIYPYHGDYLLKLQADQWIEQVVEVNRERGHTLSFFVSSEDGVTGDYLARVDEYDHMRRLINTGSTFISGSHSADTGVSTWDPWTRVDAPVPVLETGTRYVSIHVEGDNILIDALQFEEGATGEGPSSYSHLPRPGDLTIEYETSDRLFYKVEDLDLSPFRNRMHEGFLHVPAVPARQFDSSAPTDATTVSDWRWANGRTDHLPWAKAHGVNKWRRVRDWDEEGVLGLPEEAAYGLRVRQPSSILVTPSIPVTRQSSRGVELVAEVRNDDGNPYSFEKVSLAISEGQGKYPGRLARREYGYFTHLGTDIAPEANNRGEVVARFIPPWVEDIEYRGAAPTAQQGVAYVDLPYRIHRGNHGNPTLHDEFGGLLDVTGEPVTELINPRVEGDYSVYDLTDRPYFGTLTACEGIIDDTGWGYPLGETRNALMEDSEFFVNYETNRVVLFGTQRQPIRVEFKRRHIWTSPQFPNRMFLDESALDGATGEVLIRYDAELAMTVRADPPDGISKGVARHRTIPVVVQNPHRGEIQ